MTKIKICGITNLEDALAAVTCGADMLGFNFYKNSPRYIDPEKVRAITDKTAAYTQNVGVFVNAPPEQVMQTAKAAGLSAVQLHGDESAEYVDGLDGMRIIKALRISPHFDLTLIDEYQVDSILLDAFSLKEYGGTGQTCDWHLAADVARKHPKVFLSGGLGANNVVEAINIVRPFAVDACSQLESTKGKKDPRKLEEFISAVKGL